MKEIRKAVIPTAGLGRRFLPITKSVPKEMLPIVDRPALEYVAEEAVNSGIEELLIIVNTAKDAVIKYFSPTERDSVLMGDARLDRLNRLLGRVKITFEYQKTPDGNGAAISLAKDFVGNEPFAVLFGDDVIYTKGSPVIAQMKDAFNRSGGKIVVGTQTRPPEEAVKYGVIKKGASLGSGITDVLAVMEKPPLDKLPSDLCSLGRFILTPEIFYALEVCPKINGEVYLTSAINMLAEDGKVVAYEFEGQRFDLGDKLGFLEANIAYYLLAGTKKEEIYKFLDSIK